ncbi:MAG: CHAT domain-containing protein [Myxococcota bacterium]
MRRHLDLLLQRARSREKRQRSGSRICASRRRLFEQLKGDELRDYYEDECVARAGEARPLSSEARRAPSSSIPSCSTIASSCSSRPAGSSSRRRRLARDARGAVARFRAAFEKRTTAQYRGPARALHRLLVEPLEPILARHPEATLVFVPDGALRTIPMAALHDGERFLIERFATVATPVSS